MDSRGIKAAEVNPVEVGDEGQRPDLLTTRRNPITPATRAAMDWTRGRIRTRKTRINDRTAVVGSPYNGFRASWNPDVHVVSHYESPLASKHTYDVHYILAHLNKPYEI
jgi:hypothetical protein